MKFSLVFENTNDEIVFEIINNIDILEYFVKMSNESDCNSFTDSETVYRSVDKLVNELHSALSLTNSITSDLFGFRFLENKNLEDYLDQKFLNQQHEKWVLSQEKEIDIDLLRFSENKQQSSLGWKLHNLYPDDIRKIQLAEAMIKLGYIFPYEEVNMTVHRLEQFFSRNIEFKSDAKWKVFDNPYHNTMISNNDVVNFSFGYTYVGRQYYNKWQFFDTELEFGDNYNYETLEFAFQLNLDRPQTIPYSPEFLAWCQEKNIPPITTQIPIANVIDIEKNLKHYRTILYRNSKQSNRSRLELH
jgi:hypothetical protein